MTSLDGGSIYDAIAGFLREQRLLFHEEPARARVRFEYASATGAWTTWVVAFEEARQVAVYGVVSVPADPPQLPALAELVTRINFGLVLGNFELDYDGGEIRCKTSLDIEDTALPADAFAALLRQLLRANLALMEHHLPAFVAAVLHSRPPAEALALLGREPAPAGGNLAEALSGLRDAANP